MPTEPPRPPERPLPDALFLELRPPPGGLESVRARLRARQRRRVVAGSLALAALALLAVLPGLVAPPAGLAPSWSQDIVLAPPPAAGLQAQARGRTALLEVGRTEDVLMVRILSPEAPEP